MKLAVMAIGFIVLTAVVVVFLRTPPRRSPDVAQVTEAKTLEEKLLSLKTCGLQLAPPFTVNDLLKSWRREEYEKSGFELVLVGLGMTEEQKPWRNHSVNLWHFETEAIEDNGDYKNQSRSVLLDATARWY